ncbi:hypothetical protein EVG20_g8416 [Dentipellis fragilis]|uniref:Aminoglycoside phosphotransferase domain-containing protein n=1 Tax=Dentipellis fragilis TaxID=205917 RepID=A0A4Y9Y788_9AGAM|nr:hypothetical protein EVG20_g8416 [Dentipellis fragilis]
MPVVTVTATPTTTAAPGAVTDLSSAFGSESGSAAGFGSASATSFSFSSAATTSIARAKYMGPFIRAPPRPCRPGYSPSPEPTEEELCAWQARLSIGNPPPTSGIQQWIYQGKYLVHMHLVIPIYNLRDRLWRISSGRYVWIKRFHAKALRDAETAALQLVAGNTTVPVPRVWLSLSWSGKHYIFMSRISGATLENVWKDHSPETRTRIFAQLRGYVAQMRTLQTPYGPRICSTVGGPCGDARLLSGSKGPFKDEDAMNTSLRCGLPFHEETSAAVRAAAWVYRCASWAGFSETEVKVEHLKLLLDLLKDVRDPAVLGVHFPSFEHWAASNRKASGGSLLKLRRGPSSPYLRDDSIVYEPGIIPSTRCSLPSFTSER